jgi:hypothetical protein
MNEGINAAIFSVAVLTVSNAESVFGGNTSKEREGLLGLLMISEIFMYIPSKLIDSFNKGRRPVMQQRSDTCPSIFQFGNFHHEKMKLSTDK